MADLTADQILDQTAIGNNLGLQVAANGSVRDHVHNAMEYYNSFGGEPDEILEQIAQNNDLGLQLSAGWIRLKCIEAMENYADQEDGGIAFDIKLSAADYDTKQVTLEVINLNELVFNIGMIVIAKPIDGKPEFLFKNSGGSISGNNSVVTFPANASAADDDLYGVLIRGEYGGDNYEYDTGGGDTIEIPLNGDATQVVATLVDD